LVDPDQKPPRPREHINWLEDVTLLEEESVPEGDSRTVGLRDPPLPTGHPGGRLRLRFSPTP
jgi:hypothetical protein